MNKKRILKLADHIESLPHVADYSSGETGFNMEIFNFNCGTPACICGWAVELWARKDLRENPSDIDNMLETGQELLGLTEKEAKNLFVPDTDHRKTTPVIAAQVLRDFAEGGEIDWPIELYD